MTFSKLVFICTFLCLASIAFGQKNYYCKLDTFDIVSNQHLDNFLYKLEFDNVRDYKDKKYIPAFIMESLDCLTGGNFSLANPSEEFRSTCTSSLNLPRRQLRYLGMNKNFLAIVYLTGGIAEETHIILITYCGQTILDMWAGSDINGTTRNRKQLISFLKKARTKKLNDFGYL